MGRTARISRAQILDAALELGLDGFSMQGIAEHLGVTPPALYSHVSGRSEVLDLVALDLFEQAAAETAGVDDWRSCLRVWATTARQRYAGAPSEFLDSFRAPISVEALDASERSLQLMLDAGFSAADAGRALWLVVRAAVTAGSETATVEVPIAAARHVVDGKAQPALSAALDDLTGPGQGDTFEFDIEVILDGLAHRLSA
jgi:TetR/AcrR family tetracycline transcriptional repressor